MRTYFIQVAKEAIKVEDFITADTENLTDAEYGYRYPISDDERQEAIACLVERVLPKGMFSMSEDGALIYNGGMAAWKRGWIDALNKMVSGFTPETIFNGHDVLYDIRKLLDNALDTDIQFFLESPYVNDSTALMSYIDGMKEGDRLYVGGIVGYKIHIFIII